MRQRKDPKRGGRAGERADDWAQNIENTFACNRILWRVVFTALRKLQKHRATRMCECVWAYLTVALLASCVSLRPRPSLAALPFVVIILLIDTDCSSVHSNISAKDFKDNTLHKNYLSSNIVYSFLHNNNHSLVDTIHRRHWGPIPDCQALLCPIPWSLHMVEIFANIMKPNMMTTTCKIITNNINDCY